MSAASWLSLKGHRAAVSDQVCWRERESRHGCVPPPQVAELPGCAPRQKPRFLLEACWAGLGCPDPAFILVGAERFQRREPPCIYAELVGLARVSPGL